MGIRNFDAAMKDLSGNAVQDFKRDLDGTPIRTADGKLDAFDVLLRDVIADSLAKVYRGDETATYESKNERWRLAKKIHKGGNIEMSVKELALVRECAQKNLGPSAIGQVDEALEAEIPPAATE